MSGIESVHHTRLRPCSHYLSYHPHSHSLYSTFLTSSNLSYLRLSFNYYISGKHGPFFSPFLRLLLPLHPHRSDLLLSILIRRDTLLLLVLFSILIILPISIECSSFVPLTTLNFTYILLKLSQGCGIISFCYMSSFHI